MRWVKGKRKKEAKKNKRSHRERKKKERKKRKGEKKKKREDFPALQRSKLDGPGTKVFTRSAIYVWTPKTWSFDKLHKVGDFHTRFTLSLKAIKWYGLFIGGHERP